ncbi:MAG: hypothetical protein IPH34_03625 [Chitinophagaceae bacterium]|nr:hypothetical protein [Chitinophagaceae bacterium]MBK8310853.1 hypothetical protein [Chitinophagaceae bacterium]MBK8605361.1 hypothetical protein [Chitinophagaceae bacterium]MBP6478946.1 hypothetical protein [Chitinophagaceae bacterium]MBP7313693.1 hypothetical protein [Chitinophagaceae bacterium]
MRDTKSLLLILLSFGLVGTWVYHLYDKTKYSKQRTEIYIKDSIAVAEGIQDSLHKLYSSTITNLDAELDSTKSNAGQLKGELGNKLSEINRLKAEIAAILKKNNVKKEDIELARKKTTELQLLVQQLTSRNNTVEEEKQQISVALDNVNIQMKNMEGNVQQLTNENKVLAEKVTIASTFNASEISLTPVAVRNDKEKETSAADKVSKLVVSFAVQNNISDEPVSEIYVVITQPDGKVLKTDVWDAFSIDTRKEGKKSYTRKVRFDYERGENKKLLFSLNADDYMKGNYKLQVYHNGYMIGQTNKVLN